MSPHAQTSRQSNFPGFDSPEEFDLDQNSPSFEYELPRNKHLLALILTLEATVSIAGGSSDGSVRSEGMLRLLPDLNVKIGGNYRYPPEFGFRQHARVQGRMTSQALVLDTLSGAGTGVGSEALVAEGLVVFSPDPFGDGSADIHEPPISNRTTARLKGRWEPGEAGSGSSDPGTAALISGGDRDVTFDSGPTLKVTPVYLHDAPRPFYKMKAVISNQEGGVFTGAGDVKVRLDESEEDLLMAIATALENGDERDRYDGFEDVSVGKRADHQNIDVRALSIRERQNFPAIPSSRAIQEFALNFADEGKLGTVARPISDFSQPHLVFTMNAPTGDGNVELITLHGVQKVPETRPTLRRRQGETASDVASERGKVLQ